MSSLECFPAEGTKGFRKETWNSNNKAYGVQILIQDQFYTQKTFEEALCVVETLSSDQCCSAEILIQVRILFPVLAFGLNVFLQIDQSLRKGQHYTKFFCCFPTFPFDYLFELLTRDVYMQPCILIILFVWINNISLMHTNTGSLSIPVSRYKKQNRLFMQHTCTMNKT